MIIPKDSIGPSTYLSAQIYVRVHKDTHRQLKKAAKSYDISVSTLARAIIENYFENQEEEQEKK